MNPRPEGRGGTWHQKRTGGLEGAKGSPLPPPRSNSGGKERIEEPRKAPPRVDGRNAIGNRKCCAPSLPRFCARFPFPGGRKEQKKKENAELEWLFWGDAREICFAAKRRDRPNAWRRCRSKSSVISRTSRPKEKRNREAWSVSSVLRTKPAG